MKTINTEEKTFNKKVKTLISNTFNVAVVITKRHIAGVGYVHFIKDKDSKITLGKVYKDGNQMKLAIN